MSTTPPPYERNAERLEEFEPPPSDGPVIPWDSPDKVSAPLPATLFDLDAEPDAYEHLWPLSAHHADCRQKFGSTFPPLQAPPRKTSALHRTASAVV